MAPAVSISRE